MEAKKLSEVKKEWESGIPVLLVEYRKSMAEQINWRDKASGKMMHAPVLRHTVETATASVMVTERVADDFKVDGYQAPFAKGQRVALYATELATDKGQLSARGQLVKVLEG